MMDEGELSQILGEQFRLFGHNVKVSCTVPRCLKPLAAGGDAVVLVKLYKGQLRVSEFDCDGQEAEIANLKRKVKEQETEIQSLNLLLEKQKPKGIPDDSPPYFPEAEQINIAEEKPKKKRKKKAEVKE